MAILFGRYWSHLRDSIDAMDQRIAKRKEPCKKQTHYKTKVADTEYLLQYVIRIGEGGSQRVPAKLQQTHGNQAIGVLFEYWESAQ